MPEINSEAMLERILSRNLIQTSLEMRSEILSDTTPVPVFGDFLSSSIVSLGLNPSSNEFPVKEEERRLVHLSDLGLPSDYYQSAKSGMEVSQAEKIIAGLVDYFDGNNPYDDWFSHAETVVEVGFGSSYYSQKNRSVKACHADVFPWATRRFKDLSKDVRSEFMKENSRFIEDFLSNEKYEYLVILGGSTLYEFERQINFERIERKKAAGPFASTFTAGSIQLKKRRLPYFFTSQGPSTHKGKREKAEIHQAFGEFINEAL